MKIGCNYWASNAGTHMWDDWDEAVVRRDFALMREAGMQLVRVFPLWSSFQPLTLLRRWGGMRAELLMNGKPLPDTPCGLAGIDETMLQRFRTMCDIAQGNGIELIVGLVTGWMSGVLYVPQAFEGLNIMSDPLAIKWEVRMVRCLVRELKDKPAIKAWELGNECNCMAVLKSPEEAWNWTNAITSAIRLEDTTRPVGSGMHGIMPAVDEEFVAPTNWSIETQGELCDFLTSHPYPHTTSKSSARLDRHDSIRLALQAAIETRLYGDIGHRPACVEELGTFSSSYCNDETKALFVRSSMYQAWAHGSTAYLWWCAFEHSVLDFPPYTWSTWERELGMYDENYRLRPVGNALRTFKEMQEHLPFKELPMFRCNAVCVLTREQDFKSFMENGWAAFVLAKQAGFDIEFQFIDEPLRDSQLYLVPGIIGTNWSRSFEYKALIDKAKQGATVYFSLDGGDLSPFAEAFGATVVTRETRTFAAAFDFDGIHFQLSAPYRLIIQPNDAEVLGTESNGNPILLRHAIGKGEIYLMTVPMERHTAVTPGAYNIDAPAWHRIYKRIAEKVIAKRIAQSGNPLVTLTEHFFTDDHAVIVAVNNSSSEVPASLSLADGWTIKWQDKTAIPPQDGAVFELVRLL